VYHSAVRCVVLGRMSAVSMKNASNLLRYLYHFLSAEDGVTTESFSVRVCLLISVFCFSDNYVVILSHFVGKICFFSALEVIF